MLIRALSRSAHGRESMTKVITYGTYDMLHQGHINLLKRARDLGDYLIVGVTSEDFDKARGKINVKQSLMERVEAVKSLGIADEVIVEEYAGQKIDDILRYNIDIFTVGSDWEGYFDYLGKWCRVIYLDRTEGISSSELRSESYNIRLGIVADNKYAEKIVREANYVNGLTVSGAYSPNSLILANGPENAVPSFGGLPDLLAHSDAVSIVVKPHLHYQIIRSALEAGKHVLCEPPFVLDTDQDEELRQLAREKELVLTEGIKTAYSTAYRRFIRLIQSGRIGKILSVDATCTSKADLESRKPEELESLWGSLCGWGPMALLPIFQLLGSNYKRKTITTALANSDINFDLFTKIDFLFPSATASIKVAKGAKSEGSLVVSGTEGYGYIPAPWWKTDYFELRFEDPSENQRFFYQLDGEGIRLELVSFLRSIEAGNRELCLDDEIGRAITEVLQDFYQGKDVEYLA